MLSMSISDWLRRDGGQPIACALFVAACSWSVATSTWSIADGAEHFRGATASPPPTATAAAVRGAKFGARPASFGTAPQFDGVQSDAETNFPASAASPITSPATSSASSSIRPVLARPVNGSVTMSGMTSKPAASAEAGGPLARPAGGNDRQSPESAQAPQIDPLTRLTMTGGLAFQNPSGASDYGGNTVEPGYAESLGQFRARSSVDQLLTFPGAGGPGYSMGLRTTPPGLDPALFWTPALVNGAPGSPWQGSSALVSEPAPIGGYRAWNGAGR